MYSIFYFSCTAFLFGFLKTTSLLNIYLLSVSLPESIDHINSFIFLGLPISFDISLFVSNPLVVVDFFSRFRRSMRRSPKRFDKNKCYQHIHSRMLRLVRHKILQLPKECSDCVGLTFWIHILFIGDKQMLLQQPGNCCGYPTFEIFHKFFWAKWTQYNIQV